MTVKKKESKEEIKKVKAKAEAKPKAEAKAKVEAKPKPQPKPKLKAKAEVKVKTEAKAKVEIKPKAEVKPKPQPKPEIKVEAKPKVEVKAKVEVKPKAEVKPKVEVKAEVKAKVEVKPKAEVKVEPKAEAKAKVEEKPKVEVPLAPVILQKIEAKIPISVKDLAAKLSTSPSELIKRLIKRNVFATINQMLDEKAAAMISEELGYQIAKAPTEEEAALKIHEEKDDPSKLKLRPPVVTMMGHVDHGKTSLLDAIRKTDVAANEAGGITQHIGAYEVSIAKKGEVTFLDTPGHEAFTSMRARGANATDIVVLVVAADDGVKPQTIEAIDHARAAEVPIVVAINKIDKPNINLDMVKKQLAELDLLPEDWGGKTITIGVSAKTGQGIDTLLEMLLLESEMLELRANPNRSAKGVVIEAELSKGGGPVATILIQNGTLHVGDAVVVGSHYGKIRAMIDDKLRRVNDAPPSKPVEILGLSGVPRAGEQLFVVQDEKIARDIATARHDAEKEKARMGVHRITLEDIRRQIEEGKLKELNLILKADVSGSLEAVRDSLDKLPAKDVKLRLIHKGIGDVNDSDVILAMASNAIIIGFNVDKTSGASQRAEEEKIDVRLYKIIYELTNDIRAAMEGMLEPITEEVLLGRAEVRQVFKVSKVGIIAGCSITKGKIPRNAERVKVLRNKEVIFQGKIHSLKHFKEDVKEAAEGFECGIGISNFTNFRQGDLIEAYEIKKTVRRLS